MRGWMFLVLVLPALAGCLSDGGSDDLVIEDPQPYS